MKAIKTLIFLILLNLLPHAGIYSKVPLNRGQFLKLEELLKLINTFKETGLDTSQLNEITLKDGDIKLKLTQFNQMLAYIENEVGLFNQDLEGIEFELDKISVNSYEYIRGIIEERRRLKNLPKKKAKPINYFANSQIMRDIEAEESNDLSKYR